MPFAKHINAILKTRTGKTLLVLGFLFAAYLTVHCFLIIVGAEPWVLRKMRFGLAARRCEPLINAIKAYHRDTGIPPEKLADLVPKYLHRVPGTGLIRHPDFEYTRYTNANSSRIWYDLDDPTTNPALNRQQRLGITFDHEARLVDFCIDPPPKDFSHVPFSEMEWRQKKGRIKMLGTIPLPAQIFGATSNVVINTLGPPDESRIMHDAPWQLGIECGQMILGGLDYFLYEPSEKYSRLIPHTNTERIGNWAYMHE